MKHILTQFFTKYPVEGSDGSGPQPSWQDTQLFSGTYDYIPATTTAFFTSLQFIASSSVYKYIYSTDISNASATAKEYAMVGGLPDGTYNITYRLRYTYTSATSGLSVVEYMNPSPALATTTLIIYNSVYRQPATGSSAILPDIQASTSIVSLIQQDILARVKNIKNDILNTFPMVYIVPIWDTLSNLQTSTTSDIGIPFPLKWGTTTATATISMTQYTNSTSSISWGSTNFQTTDLKKIISLIIIVGAVWAWKRKIERFFTSSNTDTI